jgi:hypothetical protein
MVQLPLSHSMCVYVVVIIVAVVVVIIIIIIIIIVCYVSKNCPSARCASVTNVVCRDVHVFGPKTIVETYSILNY